MRLIDSACNLIAMQPCSNCGVEHERKTSWCRLCCSELEAKRRLEKGVPPRKKWLACGPDQKQCRQCEKVLPNAGFRPSRRGINGVSAYCIPCEKVRYQTRYANPKKSREATARYRERHRARWRSLHRLNQFKRRLRIFVTDTVSDAILEGLYSQATCHYCRKATEEKHRTLDHVVALASGGTHTADNLVMACRSCNSSKQHKDLKEWKSLQQLLKTAVKPTGPE